jgi:hypothetical protein
MYHWKNSAQVFGEKFLEKNRPDMGGKAAWIRLVSDFHNVMREEKLLTGVSQCKRYGWKNQPSTVILRPEKSINFIINTTKWPIPAKSLRSSAPSLT